MDLIPNLAFFVVGILISALSAWFICRKLINATSETATANGAAERSTSRAAEHSRCTTSRSATTKNGRSFTA